MRHTSSMMRALKMMALPILALVLFRPGAATAGGTVREEPVRIFAHYMPWFRAEMTEGGTMLWEHWEWFGRGTKHDPDTIDEDGRHDIASVYYPLIGPYDSRDPAVLEYHFLTARAAGIEGFIADWYGPGTYSDDVFGRMLGTADRFGMKVAICLEEKTFFPGYADVQSRAAVLDVAEAQIRHILETHARSSAYLRMEGRPVMAMFVNHQQGLLGSHVLTPEELADLLARFSGDPVFFLRGEADPAYMEVVDGVYAWAGDAAYRSNFYIRARSAVASNRAFRVVGGAMPGFDDRGVNGWGAGPRLVERRGVQEYDEHWKDVVRYRPAAVQIATWNDFQEGSTIEPAEEYGFRFVDRTEEWVATLNGRKVCVSDNQWPYRIYLLRKGLALAPEATRADLEARLEALVADVASGRRFMVSYRLGRLEALIRPAQHQEEKIE